MFGPVFFCSDLITGGFLVRYILIGMSQDLFIQPEDSCLRVFHWGSGSGLSNMPRGNVSFQIDRCPKRMEM